MYTTLPSRAKDILLTQSVNLCMDCTIINHTMLYILNSSKFLIRYKYTKPSQLQSDCKNLIVKNVIMKNKAEGKTKYTV